MTETTIDLRYLAENQPSVCIPRVFNNITEQRVRQVFDELGLGKISRIDVKERTSEKGESFKRVYVHFEKWFWNDDAQAARRKLISGKEIKIVYDNPWFWKVSASKWSSPSEERAVPQRPKVHIDFDDTERPNRRPDLRERRRPDSRERRRPDTREEMREEKRRPDLRERRRPDTREEIREERRRPEKRVEERKPEKSVIDNPDHITHLHQVKVDYGDAKMPLLKKKQKKSVPVEEKEIVESEEHRKACEELYGDLKLDT
jgi:hypothetical protein